MIRCPVCSKLMEDCLICPTCQFDSSLDYEILFTLSPVTKRVASASEVRRIRKMELKGEFDETMTGNESHQKPKNEKSHPNSEYVGVNLFDGIDIDEILGDMGIY